MLNIRRERRRCVLRHVDVVILINFNLRIIVYRYNKRLIRSRASSKRYGIAGSSHSPNPIPLRPAILRRQRHGHIHRHRIAQ